MNFIINEYGLIQENIIENGYIDFNYFQNTREMMKFSELILFTSKKESGMTG